MVQLCAAVIPLRSSSNTTHFDGFLSNCTKKIKHCNPLLIRVLFTCGFTKVENLFFVTVNSHGLALCALYGAFKLFSTLIAKRLLLVPLRDLRVLTHRRCNLFCTRNKKYKKKMHLDSSWEESMSYRFHPIFLSYNCLHKQKDT